MSRYELRLAKSLAHVVNILDPDVIVLGGGMSNVDRLYQNVPTLMKQFVFGGECETPLRKALHGDSNGVRGAALAVAARINGCYVAGATCCCTPRFRRP